MGKDLVETGTFQVCNATFQKDNVALYTSWIAFNCHGTDEVVTVDEGTSYNIYFSGLESNTLYSITVTAINCAGSNKVNTTVYTLPTPPNDVHALHVGIGTNSAYLVMVWTQMGAPSNQWYNLRVSGSSFVNINQSCSGSTCYFKIATTTLNIPPPYSMEVATISNGQMGPYSLPLKSAVGDITGEVSSQDSNHVTVKCTFYDGFSHYCLLCCSTDTSVQVSAYSNVSSSSGPIAYADLYGLKSGAVYYCKAFATDISSVSGVQQGDPLGPLLFALVLHKLVSSLDADDECADLILQPWYLDDVALAGSHTAVLCALRLIEEMGPALGLCSIVIWEKGHGLTSDPDHTRPAHILIAGLDRGKLAALDITITSLLCPAISSESCHRAGAAALAAEACKLHSKGPKCQGGVDSLQYDGTSCPKSLCPNTTVIYSCNLPPLNSQFGYIKWTFSTIMGNCSAGDIALRQPIFTHECTEQTRTCGKYTGSMFIPCTMTSLAVMITQDLNGTIIQCLNIDTLGNMNLLGTSSIVVSGFKKAPGMANINIAKDCNALSVGWVPSSSGDPAISFAVHIQGHGTDQEVTVMRGPATTSISVVWKVTLYTPSQLLPLTVLEATK
ncbi:hypothetical protein EMCRGX_G015559 [Ephydatia muelleri]